MPHADEGNCNVRRYILAERSCTMYPRRPVVLCMPMGIAFTSPINPRPHFSVALPPFFPTRPIYVCYPWTRTHLPKTARRRHCPAISRLVSRYYTLADLQVSDKRLAKDLVRYTVLHANNAAWHMYRKAATVIADISRYRDANRCLFGHFLCCVAYHPCV